MKLGILKNKVGDAWGIMLDHKTIGYNCKLFHLEDDALGVFWHPMGEILYSTIRNYIQSICTEFCYHPVRTPFIFHESLWKASGHWDKFYENMFALNDGMLIKPMNCPAHVKIFNKYVRTYKELPFRLMEFGVCHRNEPSGSVLGMMRIKSFTQDDGHIFCTEDDIAKETVMFCNSAIKVYNKFGLKLAKVRFSDRPENRIGNDDIWDKAEQALQDGLRQANINYELNKGDGAFYGPKLELVLTDAMNREWQCGTLQVDFFMPTRLGATYTDKFNKVKHPIMIHRAILGSFERFIAIVLEHYQGKLPYWLAPVQVTVIALHHSEYVNAFLEKLKLQNIRYDYDKYYDENLSNRIASAATKHVPYICVIGKREEQEHMISVRIGNEQCNMQFDDFIEHINRNQL